MINYEKIHNLAFTIRRVKAKEAPEVWHAHLKVGLEDGREVEHKIPLAGENPALVSADTLEQMMDDIQLWITHEEADDAEPVQE